MLKTNTIDRADFLVESRSFLGFLSSKIVIVVVTLRKVGAERQYPASETRGRGISTKKE